MVFLDEPSAGMDPVARRFMWTVVQGIAEKRKKSVVILTTHSMEEAEALCSRMAIQVDGRFRCLGGSQQIKSRYGQGLEVNIRVAAPPQEAVTQLAQQKYAEHTDGEARAEMELLQESKTAFEQRMALAFSEVAGAATALVLLEGSGSSFRYQIMPAAMQGKYHSLGAIFGLLQDTQNALGLADFNLSQTSLEQIFNRFATMQGSQLQMAAQQPPPQLYEPQLIQQVPEQLPPVPACVEQEKIPAETAPEMPPAAQEPSF